MQRQYSARLERQYGAKNLQYWRHIGCRLATPWPPISPPKIASPVPPAQCQFDASYIVPILALNSSNLAPGYPTPELGMLGGNMHGKSPNKPSGQEEIAGHNDICQQVQVMTNNADRFEPCDALHNTRIGLYALKSPSPTPQCCVVVVGGSAVLVRRHDWL